MVRFRLMASASGPPRINLPGRETWLALLLFTALTVLLAYPLSLHPATLRFPTGADGDLGWYLLGWNTHAFLHKPWAIFDANMYYPERLTLAFGENVIGLAFFAAPVIWLTGNLLLAANFVSISSCILCGLGAYVLARRLGLSLAAAVMCGIIFECAPPRFFRIGQITLSSVQWIPFALAALHAYVERGGKRDLRLVAGFVSLQALSSGHGAVFMAVSLLVFGLYRLLLGEPLNLAKRVRDLGVAGAVLLLPTFLVFLPYLAVQREVGLKRGLGGNWFANYGDFLASPSHLHRFLLTLINRADVIARPSAFLFPGYLAIALAVAAVVWRGRPAAADNRHVASTFWTRLPSVLELALLATAAVAALLTAGTLIPLRAGITRLCDPRSAALAWMLCAGIALLGIAMGRCLPADTVARHRRPLILLLATALAWTLLGVARPTLRAGNGLVGEYFTNTEWIGPPAFSAVDTRLSIARVMRRWNGAPPEQFSVRWIGFLTVGRSGLYTFATTSNDGSHLFIDNRLVVDNGGAHPAETRSGSVHLDRGSHLVELRYVQFGADAALTWSWSRDGAGDAAVPAWALSQRRARYGTVVAARIVDWVLPSFALLTVLAAARYMRAGLSGGPGKAIARWAEFRRRDATTFYTVLTLVAFGLALGPPYGLWRYVYWMPGFNFIRESSRFTLVALLGLAVLAAIGFDRVTHRWTHRSRAILATVIGVLLVAEYAAMPMAVEPSTLEVPAIDRWLDSRPKPFVVAEVPAPSEREQVAYMIHSTAHWQKTVQGYSGWRSSFHHQLYSEMELFPDETSIAGLSDIGVTYVVVHTERYPPGEWSKVEERLRQFSSRLRLEHIEGAGRVYSLVGPRAGAAR